MRRRTRGPPALRWTMLRTVTLLSVRRESGCVLAPQVVTQCVPAADAGAGAVAATTSAAAAHFVSLMTLPPLVHAGVCRIRQRTSQAKPREIVDAVSHVTTRSTPTAPRG